MKLTCTKYSLAVAVTALTLIVVPSFVLSAAPYYAFYPSEHGQHWKRFEHNILGVSVDIPSSWKFGIVGAPPTAVIMLYPGELNTSTFSEDYGTIEVGSLPFENVTLEEAARATLVGMKQRHGRIDVKHQPLRKPFGELDSIQFYYSWPSKSGYQIQEKVTLVKKNAKIYSVTVRAVSEALAENEALYDKVIRSFKPLKSEF